MNETSKVLEMAEMYLTSGGRIGKIAGRVASEIQIWDVVVGRIVDSCLSWNWNIAGIADFTRIIFRARLGRSNREAAVLPESFRIGRVGERRRVKSDRFGVVRLRKVEFVQFVGAGRQIGRNG